MATFTSLSELMSEDSLKLLTASGKGLIREIGFDVARNVVYNVMIGRNLRDSTEVLTRRRIATLNLAIVDLFFKGSNLYENFVEQLPYLATSILTKSGLSKSERWLALWVLGLNEKAADNILRRNQEALENYRDTYIQTCRSVIQQHAAEAGELSGELSLSNNLKAEVNWLLLTYLLNTVGAQTLAIRGSEKSAYGKLFEKLILGSLLSTLGFKLVPPERPGTDKNVFWLSSRGEKRESDATLLYETGKAVRFDIGFIGRGNPEISLDKVSRFERELVLSAQQYAVETIVIVDTIGKNSRIGQLAKRVNGHIVQMSATYWPLEVAQILNLTIGYTHPILSLNGTALDNFIANQVKFAPLETFIQFTDG